MFFKNKSMPKTNILFLGTGNALMNEDGNFHSNLILQCGSDTLFIDCGSDFPHAIARAGFKSNKVEHLYISHVHADHAGGLEWLAFMDYFVDNKRTKLYIPNALRSDLSVMLKPSTVASIADVDFDGLGALFDLQMVDDAKKDWFELGNIRFTPVKTIHVSSYAKLYSYALRIITKDAVAERKIFFSSDTQFDPKQLHQHYEWADLILHDCSTSPHPYNAHVHFDQLCTLPLQIREKMILYHYGPGDKPDAERHGFRGFAVPRVLIEL